MWNDDDDVTATFAHTYTRGDVYHLFTQKFMHTRAPHRTVHNQTEHAASKQQAGCESYTQNKYTNRIIVCVDQLKWRIQYD